MLSLDRRMSFDVEFNRVAITVAEMLTRQMDDIALHLVRDAGPDPHDANNLTVKAANRIVVLSRWLVDEIRFYEHCERLRFENEEEDMPF